MESRRFYRAGILALDPQAFGLEFLIAGTAPAQDPYTLAADGKVAVVSVKGPLTHGDPFFDSYAAIRKRTAAAFESSASVVVLDVDSPGGDVFGVFDTARAIRADARKAGKRLVAFSEARMQSAGYALACAADEIVCTSVASVGSIGVIVAHADITAADKAMGVRFEVFASGARKPDGNPHIELTDEARASIQRSIDDTAAVFFDLVRESRKGLEAKPLEGQTWVGVAAVAARVVDRVESRDQLLARLAAEPAGAIAQVTPQASKAETNAMTDDEKEKDEDRKALAAAAAKGSARAQRALAAYDSEDDKKAESEDEDKKASDEDKEEKSASAADDEDEKKASAAAATVAGSLAGQVSALTAQVAELKAARDAETFGKLKASRADIADAVWKTLESLPLKQARAIVDATPKAGNPLAPPSGNPALEGAPPADPSRTPAARVNPTVTDIKDPKVARAFGLLPAELPEAAPNVHYPSARKALEAPR